METTTLGSVISVTNLGEVEPLHEGGLPREDGHPDGGVFPGGASWLDAGENSAAMGSSCCGSVWAQMEAC